MTKQMIFCVETNKRAGTDKAYILETLRYWYDIGKNKITFVCMDSKTKYKAKNVVKEIKDNIIYYKNGESYVIYCIDTDSFEINIEHRNQLLEIEKYCKDNNYEFVWFCHDIEEVYLGKSISDSQKRDEAAVFKNNNMIKEVPWDKLNKTEKHKSTSNILNVVDKYLPRK